ncbi:alpha/beta fold hydrolase [Streptomyces sp. NPDC127114]|uniref:alpha/beta fold hydrolase n=1 Tax=Streptomyces sp. NPDC127114 TaxID=3345366 RepID=UPI00363CE4A0
MTETTEDLPERDADEAPAWIERTLVREDGVRLSLRDWGGGNGGSGGNVGNGGSAGHPEGGAAGEGGCAGGQRSLLLLHGLAGHAGEWDGIARRLRADGHRVVALDQRGHGASERHPQNVSRAAYVADVLAVIAELGLSDVVLVGQSYGGHAALLTAASQAAGPIAASHAAGPVAASHAAQAERPRVPLAGAVLVEAGPGGAEPGVLEQIGGWLRAWPVPFPSREAAVAYLGGGPVGEGWADGLEERDGGLWPRFDPEVMVASLAENAGRAWWEEWDAISDARPPVPVLAVLGQRGIIPDEEYDEMARRLPELRGVCVPGTGHDLHLEQPEVLHLLISGFLAELPCAGVDSNP